MAIICRDHQLLFIMVPGTGCSVVGLELIEKLNVKYLPETDLVGGHRIILGKKHNTIPQLLKHGLITEKELAGFSTFATIRNPFDRLVTYYQRFVGGWMEDYFAWTEREKERLRKTLSPEKLDEWEAWQKNMIRRKKRRIWLARVAGFNSWLLFTLIKWFLKSKMDKKVSLEDYIFPMLKGVDMVIRYEQLETGLNQLLEGADAQKSIKLPKKNKTKGKRSYQEYYSYFSRQLGEIILRRELKSYGYVFEGPVSKDPVVKLRKGN